ncbi:unnamed protein product [Musa hybrid cultivar]
MEKIRRNGGKKGKDYWCWKVERKDSDDDDKLLQKKEAKDEPRSKDRVTEGDVERSRDDRMLAVNSKNRTIDQAEKDNLGNLALEKESDTFNVVAQESFTLVSKVSTRSAASHRSLLTKYRWHRNFSSSQKWHLVS